MENFETKDDYSFNINKMYMSDCRFSLAKICLAEVKNYYKKGINAALNLEFNPENPFILTDYARNELMKALLDDNKLINSILAEKKIRKEDVINSLINLSENNKLKLRR